MTGWYPAGTWMVPGWYHTTNSGPTSRYQMIGNPSYKCLIGSATSSSNVPIRLVTYLLLRTTNNDLLLHAFTSMITLK
uniref:Ovule protein n=1 Tax=Steinernema glaseri TaxID=37863 RepID=A0A1I7YXT1_9BILA